MKYRIGMWASAGFLVAGFWAVYFFPTAQPMTSAVWTLVRLTCPIVILSSYPLSPYLALIANAFTYALVGLIAETLRQLNHAK